MATRGVVAILLLAFLLSMPTSVWAACSRVVVFFQAGDTLDVINLATDSGGNPTTLDWTLSAFRNDGQFMFDATLPGGVSLDPRERITFSAKDLYAFGPFSIAGLDFQNSYILIHADSPGQFSLTIIGKTSVYQPQCAAP